MNGVFALIVVLNALYGVLDVSPGLAGLSLIYSISIVNTLNGLMTNLTETEQEMVSVERILEMDENENEYAQSPSPPGEEIEIETEIAAQPSSCFSRAKRLAGTGLFYSALRGDEGAHSGPTPHDADNADITAALLPAGGVDVEAGLNPMRRPDPTICIDFNR